MTASGRGAIAVIAISGPSALAALNNCFRPAAMQNRLSAGRDRIRYGDWIGIGMGSGPSTRRRPTESVVVIPTGEHAWEIHCHGGKAAVEAILDDLADCDIAVVSSPQFLSLTGDSDQLAEMKTMLASANTPLTASILLNQTRGVLKAWCGRACEELRSGDQLSIQNVSSELNKVSQFGLAAKKLLSPWRIVVAGPPNVGKSSLMNAMLGYRRSITFDQPGTTRDVITAETALGGWPMMMLDTAGIRSSDETLEAEGIRRAEKTLETADLVLLVLDAMVGETRSHQSIRTLTDCPTIEVWNKVDLVRESETDSSPTPHHALAVSATTGWGLQTLADKIIETLMPCLPTPQDIVPVTRFQRTQLQLALDCADNGGRATILQTLYNSL
jgi:tRNA modification GTPase